MLSILDTIAETCNSAVECFFPSKGSLQEHEVSFPFFAELPFEIQVVIGQLSDLSTKLSFSLTRKIFYDNLKLRPLLSWRAFAEATIVEGNAPLAEWGIEEIGIPQFYFERHLVEAAKRGHQQIFKMKAFRGKKPDVVQKTLKYAAAIDKLNDYQWVLSLFCSFDHYKDEIFKGYIKARNLTAIQKYDKETLKVLVKNNTKTFLKHANSQLFQYVRAQRIYEFARRYSQFIGCNREPAAISLFYSMFTQTGDDIFQSMRCAIKKDNLVYLEYIDHVIDLNSSHLRIAIEVEAFTVLPWLLKYVRWDPSCLFVNRSTSLTKVLSELDERGLFYDPEGVIRRIQKTHPELDLIKEYFDKISDFSFINRTGSYATLNFILENAIDKLDFWDGVNFLLNPSASYSQKKRLLKSKWATVENFNGLLSMKKSLKDWPFWKLVEKKCIKV